MLFLACTSLMFIVPSIIAKRKKKKLASVATLALTATSVLYHGTGHRWAQAADTGLAHALVAGYTHKGVGLYRKTKNPLYIVGCINSCIATSFYLANLAFRAYPLHAFVQANGTLAMVCYLTA